MRKTKNRKTRNRKTRNRKTRNRIIGGASRSRSRSPDKSASERPDKSASGRHDKSASGRYSTTANKHIENARKYLNKQSAQKAVNKVNRELKKTQIMRQINPGWYHTFSHIDGLYDYLIDIETHSFKPIFHNPPVKLSGDDDEDLTHDIVCAYFNLPFGTKLSDKNLKTNLGILRTIYRESIKPLKYRKGQIEKDILKLLALNKLEIGHAIRRPSISDKGRRVYVPDLLIVEYDEIHELYKGLMPP